MSLYLGENLISGVATPIEPTRNVGQIISSIIPLTDAGLHLLDGSVIQGGGVYDDFVQYIAGLSGSYPQCFTDETTWQNTVINKGACGKFVYNSTNNTVRLPKITGFIEGTIDSNALGDLVEAGLPNITGSLITMNKIYYNNVVDNGALYVNRVNSGYTGGSESTTNGNGICFDANRSNSIYGNSSTVQPQAIKVLYYIVIANSTKTDIEVDIDEIVTDLNGKVDVDLSNINASSSAKETIVGWGMPDWSAIISITSGYTAPKDGLFLYNGNTYSGNLSFSINGNVVYKSTGYSQERMQHNVFLPVSKGDIITWVIANSTTNEGNFVPFKGV